MVDAKTATPFLGGPVATPQDLEAERDYNKVRNKGDTGDTKDMAGFDNQFS